MKRLRDRSTLGRVILLVLVVAAMVVAGFLIPLPTIEQIDAFALAWGVWGPVVAAIVYAVLTLTPAPKALLSIAAGLVWGLGIGFLIVYVGALLGAFGSFLIGRALGRDAVERYTGERVSRIDKVMKNHGFATLLVLRLMPVVPFTAVNYSAGLTGVSRRDYALSTALGIIPGTLAFVGVGAYGLEIGWEFYVALGGLILLTVAGAWYAARARRAERAGAADADGGAAGDADSDAGAGAGAGSGANAGAGSADVSSVDA